MRLTNTQVDGIIDAITPFIKGTEVELKLYGSRVDDALKGGDIDLLLITEIEEQALNLIKEKHYLLAKIKNNIGDQKIDLKIASKHNVDSDAFLKMVIPTSISLKKWE